MPRRATDAPIYRRGDSPYWWTWVYERGRRRRISTKCTDRRAALSVAASLQREAASPTDRLRAETIHDALIAFVEQPAPRSEATQRAYGQRATNVGSILGPVRLVDLGREHVELFIRSRSAAPSTIRMELKTLRAALLLAKQRGRRVGDLELLRVPVPGRMAPRDRWLTRAEFAALCAELPSYWADWVRVAVYTGARREEVNGLRWEDVDTNAGVLHIRGSKTDGSDRHVPIAPPLLEWMRAAGQPSGPMLRRMTNPDHALSGAARRAKIPPFSPHDLRRTFASWLLQDGATERDIADLLGHSSTTLTRTVYAKTNMDRLRATISRL